MARNEIFIAAAPKQVFAVLSEPGNYAHWVVGSKEIRDADPGFPKLGTKFHHTVGFGPLTVKDHTVVTAVDPPRMLALRAKARPLGTAQVVLHLEERGTGTKVTMDEAPGDGVTAIAFNLALDLVTRGRNGEALRRLKGLVEAGAATNGRRARNGKKT